MLLKFQVRTVLENPTRYHVIQKQKNQVRQYLSESFQQSELSDQPSLQELHDQRNKNVVSCSIFRVRYLLGSKLIDIDLMLLLLFFGSLHFRHFFFRLLLTFCPPRLVLVWWSIVVQRN